MKKTLLLLSAICLTFAASAKTWTFESTSYLDNATSTYTVDGLTIYAGSTSAVACDANNKTVDGISYTRRLKMGGTGAFDPETGAPVSRVLAFPITGKGTLTIVAQSSSSTADRACGVRLGTTELTTLPAPGAAPAKSTYNYDGTETGTIYLYSTSSGINFYSVEWSPITGKEEIGSTFSIITLDNSIQFSENVMAELFNINGSTVRQINAGSQLSTIGLNKGIYIVKAKAGNGTTKMQKVLVR